MTVPNLPHDPPEPSDGSETTVPSETGMAASPPLPEKPNGKGAAARPPEVRSARMLRRLTPFALMLLVAFTTWRQARFIEAHNGLPTGDEQNHICFTHDVWRFLAEQPPHRWPTLLGEHAPSDFYPPFVYLVSAPFFALAGPHYKSAQLGALPFVALFIVAAWSLGRSLFGRGGGLLAAFLAATCPAVLWSSSALYQDVPVLAMATAVLALLAASRGFTRRGAGLAAGLALGLGMLTKQSCWVFVLPFLLWTAFGPAWRALRWPERLALLALGVGAPAVAATYFVHLFSSEWTRSRFPSTWIALAVWTLALVTLVPWRVGRGSPQARSKERARMFTFCFAVAIAWAVSGRWMAGSVEPLSRTFDRFVVDSHLLLASLTRTADALPQPWGDAAARAEMYGLQLLHVMNALPVALCALVVLAATAMGPRRWRRAVPVAMCLVGAYLFYVFAFQIFRNGYIYPAIGPIVVLAAGVVRARGRMRAALLGMLIATGLLSIAGPWPGTGWIERVQGRSPTPLLLDEWALEPRFLFARAPDDRPTDVDRLFRRVADDRSIQPLLCIVPSGMEYGIRLFTQLNGLYRQVIFLQDGHMWWADRRADGVHIAWEEPPKDVKFSAVLAPEECAIGPDGSVTFNSIWGKEFMPGRGRLEPVDRFRINVPIPNTSYPYRYVLYRLVR